MAVFLSIPLSALAAFIALGLGNNTVNAMFLGGLALAFSRLIDNSVVVLENIFRHLEMGEPPEVAAESGGQEVALPVLAATLTTVDGFFPGHFSLWRQPISFHGAGVGGGSVAVRFLFRGDDGRAVVLRQAHQRPSRPRRKRTPAAPETGAARFNRWFNRQFKQMLDRYEGWLNLALLRPVATVLGITGIFILSLGALSVGWRSVFSRAPIPASSSSISRRPTGTRIELTDQLVEQVEQIVREVVPAKDLKIIVSNIGVTPGFSSIYTPNSGPHTAFVQVGLQRRPSFEQLSIYGPGAGAAEKGIAAGHRLFPDRRSGGRDFESGNARAAGHSGQRHELGGDPSDRGRDCRKARALPGVSDVLVPQDVDYPALQLDIDRVRASELG